MHIVPLTLICVKMLGEGCKQELLRKIVTSLALAPLHPPF